jgi:hypothetical protein
VGDVDETFAYGVPGAPPVPPLLPAPWLAFTVLPALHAAIAIWIAMLESPLQPH